MENVTNSNLYILDPLKTKRKPVVLYWQQSPRKYSYLKLSHIVLVVIMVDNQINLPLSKYCIELNTSHMLSKSSTTEYISSHQMPFKRQF